MLLFRAPAAYLGFPLLMITASMAGCVAGAVDRVNGSLGSAGSSGSAAGSGSGASAGAVPFVKLPDGTSSETLLAARIRRLTVAEYEASLRDIVGDVGKGVTAPFGPDALQGAGFTVNAAQIVDPVLIKQLSGVADAMAANVKTRLTELAPCADPVAGAEACAKTFIQTFASRAYRRPLDADEAAQLLIAYHVAADGAAYADGIEQVARAVLQAASFLYQTEIGDGGGAAVVTLSPYELANTLSYLVNEKPASAALVADAVAGKLDTPEGRAAATTQLASNATAPTRLIRVVGEWLGTSRIADTAKDTTVYQAFANVQPQFVAENSDFLNYLLTSGKGNVQALLGSTETYGDQNLAAFYKSTVTNPDASQKGVIQVPDRVGILNRGAFLSVFAHASEPAPVLRGVAVMRRVLCTDPGDPTKLKLTVPAPVVDPKQTIRQRFEVHASNAQCAGCHTQIDAYGFAFEHYDGMGAFQATEKVTNPPNGQLPAADSSTAITFGTQFDGSYADSNALATAIAIAPSVRVCFARQFYRAFAGTSDAADSASEERFVTYWQNDSAASATGDILGTVKDFAANPAFALRRAQ
jgi:Protein of unknown function (DUF1588)/Protein of unknown function (DUF1592)/Protein of unknown function (DUF1595)/Protein of unknown function (DUF1587)